MIVRPAPAVIAFLGIERLQAAFFVEVVDDIRDEHFEAVVLDLPGDRILQQVLLVLIVSDGIIRLVLTRKLTSQSD